MSLDARALANAIRAEMGGAWTDIKGEPYPGNPQDPDQLVLFLAIARGLLKHLKQHEDDAIATIDLRTAGGTTTSFEVTSMVLDVTTT